jgi:hypothetical protein
VIRPSFLRGCLRVVSIDRILTTRLRPSPWSASQGRSLHGCNYLAHSSGDAINTALAAVGYNFHRLIRWPKLLPLQILFAGPSAQFQISFEVFADDFPTMMAQGRTIASWGRNVNVKVPVTNTKGDFAGSVIRTLSGEGSCWT